MAEDLERADMTPEQRHALADALGHFRAGASSLVDAADVMDSVNLDHVRSLDHERTDDGYESLMSAALFAAHVADVTREMAECMRTIADDTAGRHGINRHR